MSSYPPTKKDASFGLEDLPIMPLNQKSKDFEDHQYPSTISKIGTIIGCALIAILWIGIIAIFTFFCIILPIYWTVSVCACSCLLFTVIVSCDLNPFIQCKISKRLHVYILGFMMLLQIFHFAWMLSGLLWITKYYTTECNFYITYMTYITLGQFIGYVIYTTANRIGKLVFKKQRLNNDI